MVFKTFIGPITENTDIVDRINGSLGAYLDVLRDKFTDTLFMVVIKTVELKERVENGDKN